MTQTTQNAGYTIVASVQFPNPLDSKLFTVMGVNEFGACVVWTYNLEFGGFCNGQYFTCDDTLMNRVKAWEYFKTQVEYRLNGYVASVNCGMPVSGRR